MVSFATGTPPSSEIIYNIENYSLFGNRESMPVHGKCNACGVAGDRDRGEWIVNSGWMMKPQVERFSHSENAGADRYFSLAKIPRGLSG